VGAELLHADGQTDMQNQIVSFRNFVKAPKSDSSTAMFMRISIVDLLVNPIYVESKVCWFLNTQYQLQHIVYTDLNAM
jgi:hypothetical protein